MIKFITTQTRPAKNDIVTGIVLKEGRRNGFVLTDNTAKIAVQHVIESKHVKTGFYVIGHIVK